MPHDDARSTSAEGARSGPGPETAPSVPVHCRRGPPTAPRPVRSAAHGQTSAVLWCWGTGHIVMDGGLGVGVVPVAPGAERGAGGGVGMAPPPPPLRGQTGSARRRRRKRGPSASVFICDCAGPAPSPASRRWIQRGPPAHPPLPPDVLRPHCPPQHTHSLYSLGTAATQCTPSAQTSPLPPAPRQSQGT